MLKSSGKTESLIRGRGDRTFSRTVAQVQPSPSISTSARLPLFLLSACLLFTAACRQDMQDQPKMKPYRVSSFYEDRQSSRRPIEGTVARGFLRTDTEFFTGKKRGTTTVITPVGPQPTATAGSIPLGAAAYPDDVDQFPFPITEKLLERGKERYEIFCSVCHGMTGYGDGMIVRRGFRRAASFQDERLRQAPVGHFFDAITNGWGVMPSYAPQIPVHDRWVIIAYIRALQLSQQNQTSGNATQTTPQTPRNAQPSPASGGHPQ